MRDLKAAEHGRGPGRGAPDVPGGAKLPAGSRWIELAGYVSRGFDAAPVNIDLTQRGPSAGVAPCGADVTSQRSVGVSAR
ncbi:hypothetical protein [Sorangium sp. So ce131]|uniref:hypothetical protein n=1 Tax=Sorangium sp. So ce131 TaxID=3133282 RepID=UPI003F6423F3